MAKNRMKKSGIHKKSQRALDAQKQRETEQKQAEEKAARAVKQRTLYKKNMFDAMFPLYGIGCAILSFLLTGIGVFSIGAVLFGIAGMRRHREAKKAWFWLSIAAIVLGLITGAAFIMNLFAYLQK